MVFSHTSALHSERALATFLLALARILWTVPRDILILLPASSCVRPSRSQSFNASSSSLYRVIFSISVIGTPVGLNALPLNLQPQSLGFLCLGDTAAVLDCVHMHIIILAGGHPCQYASRQIRVRTFNAMPRTYGMGLYVSGFNYPY